MRRLFDKPDGEPRYEPGAKLEELEAEKVRLFEELGRVAETQKALAARMRRVEREQRVELEGIEVSTPSQRDVTSRLQMWRHGASRCTGRTLGRCSRIRTSTLPESGALIPTCTRRS